MNNDKVYAVVHNANSGISGTISIHSNKQDAIKKVKEEVEIIYTDNLVDEFVEADPKLGIEPHLRSDGTVVKRFEPAKQIEPSNTQNNKKHTPTYEIYEHDLK